jgi:hypothetical protein
MDKRWIWWSTTKGSNGLLPSTAMKLRGWLRKVCCLLILAHSLDRNWNSVGMSIRWDYFVNQYDTARFVSGADGRDNRHIQFVREFASVVSVLQDKTNNVIDLYRDILRAVEDLATCAYTHEAFSELLSKIQAAV